MCFCGGDGFITGLSDETICRILLIIKINGNQEEVVSWDYQASGGKETAWEGIY